MSLSSRLRASSFALALSLAIGGGALVATPATAASVSPARVVDAVTVKTLSSTTPKITGTPTIGTVVNVVAGTWTSGTTLTYQWYAGGKAITGATLSKYRITAANAGLKITVKVTGKKAGYATKTVTSAATAAVPAAKNPTSTTPVPGTWNCPSWAPIKGNASSMIYHVPGGAYYARTNPEKCFTTAAAAEKAGFRASKR